MYQYNRSGDPGNMHSGRLTATSGEGSTRGMRESPYYARSEAGRGDSARSTWNPSPSEIRSDRDFQGRYPRFDHPTSDRRFLDEDFGVGLNIAGTPYTSQSERRHPSGGSSRPYAMSGNGRDPYTSGSVRMDSGDDARNTFPRDSRPTLNRRASFTGRFTSAPSVANTPNEPTLTRTKERRREATRPSNSPRSTRQPIPPTDTSSKRFQGPLKSGFYIPGSSSRSSRKQVRFDRATVPDSGSSVAYPALPPVEVEETTGVPVQPEVPAPAPVNVPSPPPPPPPPPLPSDSKRRSKSSLVAVIWRAVRRLFRK